MLSTIMHDSGNAYRLIGNTLESAAINIDGSIDMNSWAEVDFYSIDDADKTYCTCIMAALRAATVREELYARHAG